MQLWIYLNVIDSVMIDFKDMIIWNDFILWEDLIPEVSRNGHLNTYQAGSPLAVYYGFVRFEGQ